MNEKYIEINQTIDKILFEEAIRRDCGICKYLYHGTSREIAHEVENSGEIDTEYGEIQYLGKGFYVFHWDVEASKMWARRRYENESIAVLALEADLGNTFFVYEELRKRLNEQAKRIKISSKKKLSQNQKIGTIIEFGIKNIIIREYGIDIHTIGRAYDYRPTVITEDGKKKKIRRPALMYCLRNSQMINDVKIYWEE